MLLPDYLSRNLTPPIPTKDGGTLRTIGEACEYMAAIGKEREQRRHWQQVRELMLQEADVAAVSRPPPDGQPPRRSVADRKNSSGPKPDRQLRRRRSVADKESSSGPKPDR